MASLWALTLDAWASTGRPLPAVDGLVEALLPRLADCLALAAVADGAALDEDFRDILVCLQRANVAFVVVGAHALAAHGLPRATGDIDIRESGTTRGGIRENPGSGGF